MSRRVDRFPRAGRFRKGYARKPVDRLVASVEASLADGSPRLSAGDIRRAGFELVRGGYDIGSVDAALDQLEEQVLALTTRTRDPSVRLAAGRELAALCRALSAPGESPFPLVGRLRRGHDVAEVDLLISRICRPQPEGEEVTVDELRGAGFRSQRRGYDQDAVDHTLDRVIELMLVARLVDLSAVEQPPPQPRTQSLRLVVGERAEGRTT